MSLDKIDAGVAGGGGGQRENTGRHSTQPGQEYFPARRPAMAAADPFSGWSLPHRPPDQDTQQRLASPLRLLRPITLSRNSLTCQCS